MGKSLRLIFRSASFVICLFFFNMAFGQLMTNEAFLKGNFIEVGISQCASFGTSDSGNVPPGYHPRPGNVQLGVGFVADSDQDGWTAGTPNYCGDYFLPGSPAEGWVIEIDSVLYGNANATDSTDIGSGAGFGVTAICNCNMIQGSFTQVIDTGNLRSACWSGSRAGMQVDKVTYLYVDSLYFVTEVTLTNTTTSTMQNVYYGRGLDPDNDQTTGGGFPTTNTIVFQNPSAANIALVTALGGQGCYLGLGSVDTRARVAFGGFYPVRPSDAWDPASSTTTYTGGALTATGNNGTTDNGMHISFNLGDLYPGQAVHFAYAHILDQNQINSALLSTTATIYANSNPMNSTDSTFTCIGDSIPLTIMNGQNFSWSWAPSGILNVDTGISVIATPMTTTTISITGSGATCVDKYFEITLTLTPPDSLSTFSDTSLCEGTPLTLFSQIDPPLIQVWNNGSTADSLNISATGTYWVQITNPVCLSEYFDSTYVTFYGVPDVTLAPDTALCMDTIMLGAGNPGFLYAWSTGETTEVIAAPSSGEYWVRVYNQLCEDFDTTNVTFYPYPTVDAGENKDIYLGDTITLAASGATYYTWKPADDLICDTCALVPCFPLESTWFYLEGKTEFGCPGNDSVFIKVIKDETVYVPNIFTPNGDGLNDLFIPNGQFIETIDFMVYNRWGELLFISSDKNQGWDGTYNGNPAADGAYVYLLTGTWKSGEFFTDTGMFSLIR